MQTATIQKKKHFNLSDNIYRAACRNVPDNSIRRLKGFFYYDEKGQSGWGHTNKWPVTDQYGDVIGLFGISRDVTEQYETERQKKIASRVFNNVMEGIIVTDLSGRVIEVSAFFR